MALASKTNGQGFFKKLPGLKGQRDSQRDFQLYCRLLAYLKPYKKEFILAVLASIPASAINGAMAFLIGPFLDQMLKKQDFSFLVYMPIGLIIAVIIQGVSLYVYQYLNLKISMSISRDLQRELYHHMTDMDLHHFNTRTSGDLFTRYFTDPSNLQNYIVGNSQTFIMQFFTTLFLAGVLIYRNWYLSIISLAIISLILFPIQIISRKLRRLGHEYRANSAVLIDRVNETIHGAKVINAYLLKDYQRKQFDKTLDTSLATAVKAKKAGMLARPISQLIATIGIGTIIFLGGMQVKNGQMSPGELTSFVIALVLLYRPVKQLGGMAGKGEKILAPTERVFELLDMKPKLQEPAQPIPVKHFETLTVQDVHFAYEPANVKKAPKPVLNGASLEVSAGETVALVGHNGSGKTTLVDLIVRLMDVTAGSIAINGVDVRQMSLANLRRLITYVSQDTFIFAGSIRENILLGRPTATAEEVAEAVRLAHLNEWVDTLPDGLDSYIGERGKLASGGQRQRITIARAFLRNSPVLILDEATSALDNQSEAIVNQALQALMKGRTVIAIAHRLATVQQADRIYVLSEGRVVECGTHDALRAQQGYYEQLYTSQFLREDAEQPVSQAVPI